MACGAAVPEAESRDAWMYHVKELHTRFEGYECCIDASVARTAAHEDLKVLFAALAKNAGAIADHCGGAGAAGLGRRGRVRQTQAAGY